MLRGTKTYVSEVVKEYNTCPYCDSDTEEYEYDYGNREDIAELGEVQVCENCGKEYLVDQEEWND